MTGDWEFCDAPQDSAEAELLDTGHESQQPRWLKPVVRGAAGLVVVAVLVALIQIGRHPKHQTAAKAVPSADSIRAAPPMSARQFALATIRDQAHDPLGTLNVINANTSPGSCRDLPLGDKPERRLVTAVHRILPRFSVTGSSRTIDQRAQLCTVALRAKGPTGVILVLRVISPPPPAGALPGIEHATDLIGTTVTSYAKVSTTDGWTVITGATGPSAGVPAFADLLRLARDSGLRW